MTGSQIHASVDHPLRPQKRSCRARLAVRLLLLLAVIAAVPGLTSLSVHAQSKTTEGSGFLLEAGESGYSCSPATPCPPSISREGGLPEGMRESAAIAPAVSDPEILESAVEVSEGFWLAWLVMGVLVTALAYALVAAVVAAGGGQVPAFSPAAVRLIPVLSLIGMGIALYLTYVESRNVSAVCGPVGDCNAVQSSPFAKLLGVIPVGLLGALGYLSILGAWFLGRREGAVGRWMPLVIFSMALFGVLFSIYLTYLELFVIKAVCIWCVASAFIMAFVLALSVGPAVDALTEEQD